MTIIARNLSIFSTFTRTLNMQIACVTFSMKSSTLTSAGCNNVQRTRRSHSFMVHKNGLWNRVIMSWEVNRRFSYIDKEFFPFGRERVFLLSRGFGSWIILYDFKNMRNFQVEKKRKICKKKFLPIFIEKKLSQKIRMFMPSAKQVSSLWRK